MKNLTVSFSIRKKKKRERWRRRETSEAEDGVRDEFFLWYLRHSSPACVETHFNPWVRM